MQLGDLVPHFLIILTNRIYATNTILEPADSMSNVHIVVSLPVVTMNNI